MFTAGLHAVRTCRCLVPEEVDPGVWPAHGHAPQGRSCTRLSKQVCSSLAPVQGGEGAFLGRAQAGEWAARGLVCTSDGRFFAPRFGCRTVRFQNEDPCCAFVCGRGAVNKAFSAGDAAGLCPFHVLDTRSGRPAHEGSGSQTPSAQSS